MLASLGGSTGGTPPADDDDPLTSPSFSRRRAPLTDSRSYGSERKAHPSGAPESRRRDGNTFGTEGGNGSARGNGSSAYHPGNPTSPGYRMDTEPTPATWYGTPDGYTPTYENPPAGYPGQAASYQAGSSPGYSPSVGSPDYAGYPNDAAAGYTGPAYPGEPPGYPAQQYELLAASVPYPDVPSGNVPPGAGQPSYPNGYAEQNGYVNGQGATAQYADPYGNTPYPTGYPTHYNGQPYPADGYEGYPPQA